MNEAILIAGLVRQAIELAQRAVARGAMTQAELDEVLEAAHESKADAMGAWRERLDRVGRRA